MDTNKIITFPRLAQYHIPINLFFELLFKNKNIKIMTPPPITKQTLALGSMHSPEFVCLPFKYNLGNFIEALNMGANVLVQATGGCRFGFYGEVQEQILKDLGYDFKFFSLLSGYGKGLNIKGLYKNLKKLDSSVRFSKFCYYAALTVLIVRLMDKTDFFIRENIGFETVKGSFEKVYNEFICDIKKIKTFKEFRFCRKKYKKAFRNLKTEKPKNCLKVGLVGELYDLMEPSSNFYLEKELAGYNIMITRYTNASYLLFKKNKIQKKVVKSAGEYIKYHLGADGTESVANSLSLAKKGYDGIIHIKPFGCTPEVNAMPMLANINKDYKIPVLYFSFDSLSSETGIKTRLEAFYDMLINKKNSSYHSGKQ